MDKHCSSSANPSDYCTVLQEPASGHPVTTCGSSIEPDLWQQALASLQQRIKPQNFDMWLRPIICTAIEDRQIILRAPNRYIKDWFEDNYLPVVHQELRNQTQREFQIRVELEEPEAQPLLSSPPPSEVDVSPPTSDFDLNERYLFDSFVVGPSNQMAHAAARAVTEMPGAKYNPLFVYGGVGLGKTHLLCAIGHELRRTYPRLNVIYLSSERFLNEYIIHLRSNRMEEFRTTYRERCDVLLMDDIQFLAGKDRTQDEFFHTFNTLYDLHRQIVVTSDKYPHQIPDLEERLRTRFQWGLIADIQQPDLETRAAILRKKADDEHIALPSEVALFLASHIKSNVRELEGSLLRVAAAASLQRAEITIDFAQQVLKSFLGQHLPTLTIETIQKEVAAYFNVKVVDLKSAKRHKAVAYPRQIAMYLSRKLTSSSFPEIGQRFGGKDHSTVISACRKIHALVDKDLGVRTTVEALERQLQL